MARNGYAVADFKTTGLTPQDHHRVITISFVNVGPDRTIEVFSKVIANPGRHLGPTRIHTLRGYAVKATPPLTDLVEGFVDHPRGRVRIANNARFETTLLRVERTRLGLTSPVSYNGALTTTYLPGSRSKLADCYSASGIPIDDMDWALADAGATVRCLGSYLALACDQVQWWRRRGYCAARPPWPGAFADRRATGSVLRQLKGNRNLVRARDEQAGDWAVGTSRPVSLAVTATSPVQL
jgi:DNA polymerase-3 subunit epsilon